MEKRKEIQNYFSPIYSSVHRFVEFFGSNPVTRPNQLFPVLGFDFS
jgi:hypothetical protein